MEQLSVEEKPELNFWMLNIIHDALQKEYNRYKKQAGINAMLKKTADNRGQEFAKKLEAEINENRFHPLGSIWQSMKRVEEMREYYSDSFYQTQNKQQI